MAPHLVRWSTAVVSSVLLGLATCGPPAQTTAVPDPRPATPRRPPAPKLEPRQVHALIVGVLTFEGNRLSGWSARHRKDQELYDLLRRRGVPAQNMTLLLDQKATLKNVRAALKRVAARAGPGSLLLVYYAGHGVKGPAGRRYYVPYDGVPGRWPQTGWGAQEIGRVVARHFNGRQALFLADCCYSGALKGAAQQVSRAGPRAASLTSAAASNVSTNNWTFTQTLIDCLAGNPFCDRDGNGAITLSDMAREVADAMAHREGQLSGYAPLRFPPRLVLARARRPAPQTIAGPYRLGQYVRGLLRGRWQPARVLGRRGDRYQLGFYRYSDKETALLTAKQIRRVRFLRYEVGAQVWVLWGGRNWRARVLQRNGDFHFITYPGWASHWNEWVLSARIVSRIGKRPPVRKPAPAPRSP